jgi:sodium transport system permease protein
MKDSPRTGGPSFLSATLSVARKELLTSFRDRQTTLYTLVLPIILYPFLFWCMIQGSLFVEGKSEHTEVRLGLAAERPDLEPPGLAEALELAPKAALPPGKPNPWSEFDSTSGSAHAPEGPAAQLDRVHVLASRAPLGKEEARAWVRPGAGAAAALATHEGPDAVVYLGGGAEGGRDGAEVLYDSSSPSSRLALARVQKRMPVYVRELRERSAETAGRGGASLEPFLREPARDVAPLPARGAYLLSFILPLLFVIMAVMGAFFPAVDMTCGERERKTAETTLLLPVPRHAVHLGKILAVSVGALLATGLNLSALALSAEHLLHMLPSSGSAQIDVPVRAFLQVAPLLLLFAFFVSAVLTGVAALARTFKEGQALLGPVQILFVIPAMAGTLPGIQLSPALAGIPVINVVLCFRSLLRAEDVALPYAITAASLAALSIAAIALSLWTLSRESLFVSEHGTAWRNFTGLLRSPKGSR